jgi:hypothetical protein
MAIVLAAGLFRRIGAPGRKSENVIGSVKWRDQRRLIGEALPLVSKPH